MDKEWGIGQCPLFAGIEPERLPGVLREIDAMRMTVRRGEEVKLEGKRTLAVIVSGRVQIVQDDYWGTHSIIHMLVPGKMLGESFTSFPGVRLNQKNIAQTDCTLIAFSKDALLSGGFAEQKKLLENLLAIYGVHQRVFLQKFQLLSRRRTRERLLAYLSMLAMESGSPTFSVPFSRQEMADYLCVERSAMCTELSKLQREGMLRFKGKEFELLEAPESQEG